MAPAELLPAAAPASRQRHGHTPARALRRLPVPLTLWCSEIRIRAVGRDFVPSAMLFILSLIIGTPARLLTQPHADDATKDLEILMRRQQLRVLPGTASRVVPKDRWSSFLVTPAAAAALAPRTRPTHVDRPQGAHPPGETTDRRCGHRAGPAESQGRHGHPQGHPPNASPVTTPRDVDVADATGGLLLAAASRALPRGRWMSPRWHCQFVRGSGPRQGAQAAGREAGITGKVDETSCQRRRPLALRVPHDG